MKLNTNDIETLMAIARNITDNPTIVITDGKCDIYPAPCCILDTLHTPDSLLTLFVDTEGGVKKTWRMVLGSNI